MREYFGLGSFFGLDPTDRDDVTRLETKQLDRARKRLGEDPLNVPKNLGLNVGIETKKINETDLGNIFRNANPNINMGTSIKQLNPASVRPIESSVLNAAEDTFSIKPIQVDSKGPVRFKGDAVGMLDRDYAKEGALRESLAQRRDLYRDILGPTESQKGFQKAQNYFDIAAAAANFAAGRDASGKDVRDLSPAAQAAAAFSGVPQRISERLEEERKAQRTIDLAALEAAEKEETARRSQTGRERITAAGIQTQEDLAQFIRNFEREENESFRGFKARLQAQTNALNQSLKNTDIRANLQRLGYVAELERVAQNNLFNLKRISEAERAANKFKIDMTTKAAEAEVEAAFFNVRQENENNRLEAAQKLRNKLAGDQLRLKYGLANQEFKNINEENYNNLLDNASQRIFDEEKLKNFLEDKEKERASAARLAKLEFENEFNLFKLGEENKNERQRLRLELEESLGKDKLSMFDKNLKQAISEFEKDFGLRKNLNKIKEDELDLKRLEILMGFTKKDQFFEGTGPEAVYGNVVTDSELLNRYAQGKTSASENSLVELTTKYYITPQLTRDENQNVVERPGYLPTSLREAREKREQKNFPIPSLNKEFGLNNNGDGPLTQRNN